MSKYIEFNEVFLMEIPEAGYRSYYVFFSVNDVNDPSKKDKMKKLENDGYTKLIERDQIVFVKRSDY